MERTIKSIDDWLNVLPTRPENWRAAWFRGQANAAWDLLPMLYRRQVPYPQAELQISSWFRREARMRAAPVPDYDDLTAWLFLMRHHGVPTRLLDWSTSILVGTYFAVCSDPEVDGHLYVLEPYKLNAMELSGKGALVNLSDDEFFVKPCFMARRRTYDERNLERARDVDVAIAASGVQVDQRMVVQHSAFTLHSVNKADLTRHPLAPQFLDVYRIPACLNIRDRIREGGFAVKG